MYLGRVHLFLLYKSSFYDVLLLREGTNQPPLKSPEDAASGITAIKNVYVVGLYQCQPQMLEWTILNRVRFRPHYCLCSSFNPPHLTVTDAPVYAC